MSIRMNAIAALAAALALGSGTAMAHGRGQQLDPQQRAAKISERVKTKLAPKLGLDERTADRLAEAFRDAATRRGEAMQKVRGERQALQALVDKHASANEIDAQNRKLEEAIAALPPKGALLAQTERVLTPEQQAKLLLLAPRMHGHHGHWDRGGAGADEGDAK